MFITYKTFFPSAAMCSALLTTYGALTSSTRCYDTNRIVDDARYGGGNWCAHEAFSAAGFICEEGLRGVLVRLYL